MELGDVIGLARQRNRFGLIVVVLLTGLFASTGSLLAASSPFGFQDRADAAKEMIVLAVQQGISSLPPTSSQSFSYEYDAQKDTYVRSQRLGPTVLRSPQTMGMGHFSFRVAASYFELDDSFGPIDYLEQLGQPPMQLQSLTRIGLEARAEVTLLNLAVTYGLTSRVEINANLPLVAVRAKSSDLYLSDPNAPPDTLAGCSIGGINCSDQAIDTGLKGKSPTYVIRHLDYHRAGTDFPGATNFGVGRLSVGSKVMLYSGKRLRFTFAPEFFFPSPNEGELAGSESAAILPRAITAFTIADPVRLYVDAGYDYDFDHDELRRFVWTAGMSVAAASASLDVGLGGSKFNQGIQWTPTTTGFGNARTASFPIGTLTALGRNRLGSNFVDCLVGLKIRVAEKAILNGAVSVPVNNEGFRPDAIGTVALEFYL